MRSTGGIPPSPSQCPATSEIAACRERLIQEALASCRSTALRDMIAYIEAQADLALETSGDAMRRWVDTYA